MSTAVTAPRSATEICADLDILVVPTTVRRGPGQTCAVRTIEKIIQECGEGHTILTLRTISESQGNQLELTAPTIWAVSDIIRAHPKWADRGLAFLEAFDAINLAALRAAAKANRRAVAPRRAIATMLFERLTAVFDESRQGSLL